MKTTENTNTTENPWLEGMKGSHDSSWLGRFWRRLAGVGVAGAQVSNAHAEAVREGEELARNLSIHVPYHEYDVTRNPHPSLDMTHPLHLYFDED